MNALEKLKLAKRTGARATDVELATKKIYDEVTEEQYESVVAKRRKEGNFVVGDGTSLTTARLRASRRR